MELVWFRKLVPSWKKCWRNSLSWAYDDIWAHLVGFTLAFHPNWYQKCLRLHCTNFFCFHKYCSLFDDKRNHEKVPYSVIIFSIRSEAGLFSALFVAIVPSYMSRSVAGSYDNEGVSIFALVFTFYLFLKAVNTGSVLWSLYASLAYFFSKYSIWRYFYMVASWGGYAFIINIIPIFVVFLIITDRFNQRVYVAYNIFYIMGTLLAMQI